MTNDDAAPPAERTTPPRRGPRTRTPLWRLILWPALITLAVSIARYLTEVAGGPGTASGGGGFWLGISWLPYLFGAWFAYRLKTEGSRPVPMPVVWLVAILLAVALFVIAAANLGGAGAGDSGADDPRAQAKLESAVRVVALAAIGLAAMSASLWPRLGLALLLYGVTARLTVVAITAVAKAFDHDTHYTKFGPAGYEYDFARTLYSAAFSQLLFWVPYTILTGMVTGTVFFRIFEPRYPQPSRT